MNKAQGPTTSANMGDKALIAAIANGDRHALAHLYHKHGAALVAIARQGIEDPRTTEDLIHDLFLDIWACAHTYDPTRSKPDAWILGRLRALASDRLQRQRDTQKKTGHDTKGH